MQSSPKHNVVMDLGQDHPVQETPEEPHAIAADVQQLNNSSAQAASIAGINQLQIYLKMVVQQQDLHPSICRRGDKLPSIVGKITDWATVKKHKHVANSKKESQRERDNPRSRWAQQRAGVHKIAGTAGRTFTSRFRGVHQTFPTKRWEAQFRRNGKPTSLGCFDQENQAARAYDRMMLWCEIHGAAGSMKGSVTNFGLSEYEKDIAWLTNITQDDLIESLRSEGRKQAMNRQAAASNAKRSHDLSRGARSGGQSADDGGEATAEGADTTGGFDDGGACLDEEHPGGDTYAEDAGGSPRGVADGDVDMPAVDITSEMATAVATGSDSMFHSAAALLSDAQAATAAAAAAGHTLLQEQSIQDVAQQEADMAPLSVSIMSPTANPMASPAAAAAAALFAASPAAAAATSPAALNLLFGSIGQDALAAVQQLQQQLDQAAASGTEADAAAAAEAAFQIGQIAGSNLLAALHAQPSPGDSAAEKVPLPFAAGAPLDTVDPEGLAECSLDDMAAAATQEGDMLAELQAPADDGQQQG